MLVRPSIVHLHSISLDASQSKLCACRGLLTPDEHDRARRYSRPILANRWALARAGLRSVLAYYCGINARDIRLATAEFGKPELSRSATSPILHFNLSHSANIAVVAVSRDGAVGVDIELEKPLPDWQAVARHSFASSENAELASIDESQRINAFYACWTRKEAVIKATGEGFSANLQEFQVSLAPDTPAAVLADVSPHQRYAALQLHTFRLGSRFTGAVAAVADREMEWRNHGFWSIDSALH